MPSQCQTSQAHRSGQQKPCQTPNSGACRNGDIGILTTNGNRFSENLFRQYGRIDIGHRVASRDEIPFRTDVHLLKNPVDEETAVAGEEYDVAHKKLFEPARLDGQQVARPKRGQHAVAECREADLSRGSENLRNQVVLNLVPGLSGLRHGLQKSGASATAAALELRSHFAAGKRHRFKNFFRTERRLTVGLLHCLSAVKSVLLFISRRTVLLSHRNSRGP